MGVPWEECQIVGKLVGLKTMVNEFVAFEAMGKETLSVSIYLLFMEHSLTFSFVAKK